tara:strand:- start:486 stop:1532 length:1047 start_codon:yes stop_codon:yes gene_type:complete
MLSTKGSVQFYIIGVLLILVAGFVSILIYTEVSYGILSNQGNSACTLSNAFQNLYTTDDILEQTLDAGNSNCKPTSKTIRAPDITDPNRIFDTCKELQDYYGSYELALSDPEFSNNCLAYNLMNEARSCWLNYLKGNAKFSGECSSICVADSFRSYQLNENSGQIILENSIDSEVKLSNKRIQQEKLIFSDISGLYDLKDSNIAFPEYPDFIKEDDKTLINYEKNLNFVGKSPFLIDINKPKVNTQNINVALETLKVMPDYPIENLALPKDIIEKDITAQDRIVVGFVESTDIDLIEQAVFFAGITGSKRIIDPLTAYGGSKLAGSLFEFGDIEVEKGYIYFDRRGKC